MGLLLGLAFPSFLPPSTETMPHELGTRALRDLREQITRESDPEKLRELLIEINLLLSIIEQ